MNAQKYLKSLLTVLICILLCRSYAVEDTIGIDNNNKKTIYIHIGSPKTGSTSIQAFATLNHNTLLKHDVFYPIVGRHFAGPLGQIFVNGYILLKMLPAIKNNAGSITNDDKTIIEELLKEFDKSECSNMLISEEALFDEYNGGLFSICDFFDSSKYELKVIVYLRNICEYAAGLWKEDIKAGLWEQSMEINLNSTLDLESSIRLRVNKYLQSLNMLKSLSNKIGKDNIIIRTFERERWVNKDLLDDFLNIVNIKNSDQFQKIEGNINSAMSRETVEKFRYMNKYLNMVIEPGFDIEKKIPRDKTNQKVIDSVPDALIKEISDMCYPIECGIAKFFLERDELFASKYPKIYGTKRNVYNGLDIDTKKELRVLVRLAIQKKTSMN